MPASTPIRFIACLVLAAQVQAIKSAAAEEVSFEKTWTHQAGAAIYGGLRADDKRVYAGGEDGTLHALDKTDGQPAWTFDAGAAIASNVAIDDGRIYFHDRSGLVHALNRESGAETWTFSTNGERRWDYWDYYLSTPAVDDRQVYFGSGDHHVYALDKYSGHLRWKVRTGNIVHGEPAISGERVIVGGFDGKMYAIDRGTGEVLWSFKTVGNAYFRNGELPGAATVSDGVVYFGGRDYNLYALLESTGTGAWNERTPSWIVGRPLVTGKELLVVNSDGAKVFSYDTETTRLNWEFTNSDNMFAGAEALGEAHVVLAGLDGRITVLSRADGSVAGIYDTEGARNTRDRFFHEDGRPDYAGVASLEDLMGWYDRKLEGMSGITGGFVVQENRIYYATASGEITALTVNGIAVTEEG